jgi:HSP90 family molecular chaperone
LGEEIVDGEKKKFLFCLDNGIGMTKDIVKNFFLNIGNSYYKSREFERRSIRWK